MSFVSNGIRSLTLIRLIPESAAPCNEIIVLWITILVSFGGSLHSAPVVFNPIQSNQRSLIRNNCLIYYFQKRICLASIKLPLIMHEQIHIFSACNKNQRICLNYTYFCTCDVHKCL